MQADMGHMIVYIGQLDEHYEGLRSKLDQLYPVVHATDLNHAKHLILTHKPTMVAISSQQFSQVETVRELDRLIQYCEDHLTGVITLREVGLSVVFNTHLSRPSFTFSPQKWLEHFSSRICA
ncbi:MAG: hypothetical protein ACFE0Q_21195 [Anaerolineae bacterium]